MRKILKPVIYDASIATQIGINEAVILGRIAWSIDKIYEEKQEQLFYRDNWWTAISHAEFETYSALKVGAVKRALKKLAEFGLVETELRASSDGFERRLHLSLTERAMRLIPEWEPKRPVFLISSIKNEIENENIKSEHHQKPESARARVKEEDGGNACGSDLGPAVGRPEGIEAEAGAGIGGKTNRMVLSGGLNCSAYAEVLVERLGALSSLSDAGNPFVREILQGGIRSDAEKIASQCVQTHHEWATHFHEKPTQPNVWQRICLHLVETYENPVLIMEYILTFVKKDDFWEPRIFSAYDLTKVSTSNAKLFFVDQIILRMGKAYAKRRVDIFKDSEGEVATGCVDDKPFGENFSY